MQLLSSFNVTSLICSQSRQAVLCEYRRCSSRSDVLTPKVSLQVPILMKATADDETPCPGYLFEEIGSILSL